jgi:hypothetical protein
MAIVAILDDGFLFPILELAMVDAFSNRVKNLLLFGEEHDFL